MEELRVSGNGRSSLRVIQERLPKSFQGRESGWRRPLSLWDGGAEIKGELFAAQSARQQEEC